MREGTTISGRWRAPAYAVWIALTALNLTLLAVGTPIAYAYFLDTGASMLGPYLRQVGIGVGFYALFRTGLDTAVGLAFTLVGLVAFWRRRDDWMVLLVSLASISFSTLYIPTYVRVFEALPALTGPVALSRALGLALSLVAFYFLLPDGRFVPRWTRAVALLWLALVIGWLLFPRAPENLIYSTTWMDRPWLAVPLYVLFFASGIYAQIYRYRHVSGPVQRQQTKWVVWGTTAAFTGFVIYYGPLVVAPWVYEPSVARVWHIFLVLPVFDALVVMAPLSIAFSVLRYRLWQVDVIINRTLVYGSLTAVLALLYLGTVLLLQPLFNTLLGQGLDLAVAVATLALAATFNPLRRRAQQLVDRGFYHYKRQRAQVLSNFAQNAQTQIEVPEIAAELVAAVDLTLRPAHVSLLLLTTPRRIFADEAGEEREGVA